MRYKFLLTLSVLILTSVSLSAQTYYYERIKIVSNGRQKACSDDAHYITFNGNKCYDSDADGMALNSNLSMDFNRKENDILYYYGNCNFGQGCNLFVNSSKDRINLTVGNDTYVYVRTTPQASKAAKRVEKKSANPVIILPPVNNNSPVTTPSTPTENRRYPGRRECPGCRGSGKGTEIIEQGISYTGKDEYCDKCHRWGHPHYHRIPMCRVCYGKGYVE